MMTRESFAGYDGDLLVLAGDTPLLTEKTLRKLVEWHRHHDAAATILTAEMDNPTGYGRILRFEDNRVQGIVEDKDANRYERAIKEINTGTYCFDSRLLFQALGQITQENVQNEYYLTDCIRILADQGKRVEALVMDDPDEAIGVNNRLQLAQAEKVLRQRILERHMLAGITIVDPLTCYVDDEVEIGRDTILFPGTSIRGKSRVGEGCRIGPFTQVQDATIEDDCEVNASFVQGGRIVSGSRIGPFATIGDGVTA
jgi:bifunctional UDP-N-acetylglucosamine pyrophosphorylase/glucosamine-1-phosphate N-acetyltransferase